MTVVRRPLPLWHQRAVAPAAEPGSTVAGPPRWVWLFTRPLAADEHRARFWCRHLRVGVVVTEISALVVALYSIVADRPHAAVVRGLAAAVMLAAPALLALPMQRWSRDHRGALLFYGWSVLTTAVIAVVTVLDGGSSSPLVWLLVLTLAYAGIAYPPVGVVAMGALMVGTYLMILLQDPEPANNPAVVAAVLVLFSGMTAWASRNQWDMTDQQHLLAQRLNTLADTDELTGALNRRAFSQRLRRVLSTVDSDRPASLCVLDLDGFKTVNDQLGHAEGDRVLVAVARALTSAARETDSVSRLGGDEFAILMPDTHAARALEVTERLLRQLEAAVGADGVRASLGVVTCATPCSPERRDAQVEQLFATADALMYGAKASGGNAVRAS